MSREPLTVGNYFNAIALVISYIFRKLALFRLIQTNPGLSNSSVKAVFFRRCFDSIFRTILPIKTFYCDWQVSKLLTSILFYDGCHCKFFHCFQLNVGQTFNLWVKAKCLVVIFVAYKTYLMSVRMLSLTPCRKHQRSTILCSSAKLVLTLNTFLVILLSTATVDFILKPGTISKFVFSLEKWKKQFVVRFGRFTGEYSRVFFIYRRQEVFWFAHLKKAFRMLKATPRF